MKSLPILNEMPSALSRSYSVPVSSSGDAHQSQVGTFCMQMRLFLHLNFLGFVFG